MSPPTARSTSGLPWPHILLILSVMAVWGTNFVVIKVALGHLPPLLFATLRFLFAFAPAALFIRPPAAPWRDLTVYGVLIGAGQFGLLYIAMNGHISPGLASLVIQIQVAFTIAMSMRLGGERVAGFQVVALSVAAGGLAVIALHAGRDTTPLGLILVVLAAMAWAGGNMIVKRSPAANMLAYVVWASLFSVPPLLALSLIFEGWPAIRHGLAHAGVVAWAAVLWQSVGNSLFGYAAWGWLLARHPAAAIAPAALLVPVFGMAASAAWLGESLPAWKLLAAGLVLGGLVLNLAWPWVRTRGA